MHFFTKFSIVGIVCVSATLAMAEETSVAKTNLKNSLTVGYGSYTVDLSDNTGFLVEADFDGVGVNGQVYVSENVSFTLSYASLDGDIAGIDASIDSSGFGVAFDFLDDMDRDLGVGSRATVSLAASSIDLDVTINGTTTTDKQNATIASLAYTTAVQPGVSVSIGVGGDVDDFNAVIDVGAEFDLGPGFVGLGYVSDETTVAGITVEQRILSIGYGYRF
jgi:hypothetical protein